mgnify:CR=1 FL=1
MALLDCENVTLCYDKKVIVNNLSFSVKKGDYLCILGENGAGKSTLMKGILGLLKPVSGGIKYSDGKKKIGYLPQQSQIQKDFPSSVKEVILSGCQNSCGILPFYTKAQKELAKKNARLLGITKLYYKCYQELSGGQQQRVLLARALCAGQELLVLDEPAQGLDPVAIKELYELIKVLNKEYKITIIMVSHDILSAVENATHILHLDNDKTFYGTTNEYLKSTFKNKFLSFGGGDVL